MDPSTLEAIIMLRFNKDMWGPWTLQNIMDKARQATIERKRARDEAEAEEAMKVAEENRSDDE